MNLEFNKKIRIDAPVETVWRILWDDFDKVDKVLSNVKSCAPLPPGVTGDVTVDGVTGREIDMYDGSTLTELLVRVDKTDRVLSYTISGLPFGVKFVGTWTVSKLSGSGNGDDDDAENKSELILVDTAALSYWPPQFVLYPLLRLQLSAMLDAMLVDVKHYAETGEPSPGKVEAEKKAARTKK